MSLHTETNATLSLKLADNLSARVELAGVAISKHAFRLNDLTTELLCELTSKNLSDAFSI